MTQRDNTPAVFTFAGSDGAKTLRSVALDKNPWFVAPDACRALDMDMSNGAYQWLSRLSKDEKRVVTRKDVPGIFSGTLAPSLTLISESGLYRLILRAHPDRNPAVRQFQEWVTRVVLPSLRKHGGYVVGQEKIDLASEEGGALFLVGSARHRIAGGAWASASQSGRRAVGRPRGRHEAGARAPPS